MERLTALYWELFQQEGPLDIEDFLKQIKEGKHGGASAREIDDFIDETLQTMLNNISLKATEAPHYQAMRAEMETRVQERMERLKAEYGSG